MQSTASPLLSVAPVASALLHLAPRLFVSPDTAIRCAGGLLLSGGRDGVIRVWDMDALVCRRTLTGHTGTILHLAALAPGLSANGNSHGPHSYTNLTSEDERLTVGNGDEVAAALDGLGSGVVAPVVAALDSERGQVLPALIASCSVDGTARLWSADCWRCIYVVNPHPGEPHAVHWLLLGQACLT